MKLYILIGGKNATNLNYDYLAKTTRKLLNVVNAYLNIIEVRRIHPNSLPHFKLHLFSSIPSDNIRHIYYSTSVQVVTNYNNATVRGVTIIKG